MPLNSHDGRDGHRILASFATGDAGELLYLRYRCEDPTCDWCVVEFGPDECKDLVRISDDLLTHEFYNDNSQEGGQRAQHKERRSQPSLFDDSDSKG